MKELELKYYASSCDGEDSILDAWVAMCDGYHIVGRNAYTKNEFYYDTDDLALRRKGIYARLDVEKELIMVKFGGSESGLFNREEITFSTFSDFDKFVDGLDINSNNVLPRLQVMTNRRVFTLDVGYGIVEMCKDNFYYGDVYGEFDAVNTHYELEFELKSGDEKALDIIREMMLEYVNADLQPSTISKAERGFQLISKEG